MHRIGLIVLVPTALASALFVQAQTVASGGAPRAMSAAEAPQTQAVQPAVAQNVSQATLSQPARTVTLPASHRRWQRWVTGAAVVVGVVAVVIFVRTFDHGGRFVNP